MFKDDISIYACHQANKLIINSLADSLQMSREKFPFTSGEIGNESCASIPLVLTAKANEMEMKRTLSVGVGVGLSVVSCWQIFLRQDFTGYVRYEQGNV